MNGEARARTAAGLGTVGRRWAGGGGGAKEGLSLYFNSSLKRVLAASSFKHLPTSFIPLPAKPTSVYAIVAA